MGLRLGPNDMVAMRSYLHFDGTEWEDKRALRREEEKPRICLGSLGEERAWKELRAVEVKVREQ